MKNSTPKMKMAVVGGAVASAAAAANGAIVYHDPVDVTISGRTEQRAYLDLTGGTISSTVQLGVSDLVFIVGATGTSKPYTYLDQVPDSSGALVTAESLRPQQPLSMAEGVSIETATLTHGIMADVSYLPVGNAGYYGFSFDNGGTTNYGWVRADFTQYTDGTDAEDFNTITVYGWAYETSGAPIEAGATAVPEPSSAAMMAVLAGSAALYRRRSRKETAA